MIKLENSIATKLKNFNCDKYPNCDKTKKKSSFEEKKIWFSLNLENIFFKTKLLNCVKTQAQIVTKVKHWKTQIVTKLQNSNNDKPQFLKKKKIEKP